MPEAVSKDTAKLLKDVTGKTHLDSAVRATLQDALHHRLEQIKEEIEALETKYDMEFAAFEEAWEEGNIQNKYSYDVEQDYWKWEELVTREQRIEKALLEKFGSK